MEIMHLPLWIQAVNHVLSLYATCRDNYYTGYIWSSTHKKFRQSIGGGGLLHDSTVFWLKTLSGVNFFRFDRTHLAVEERLFATSGRLLIRRVGAFGAV
jgi:hypothetical protein